MTSAEYVYEEGKFKVTEKMKEDFENYGYIMIRKLLDGSELMKVKEVLEENKEITKHSYGISDGTGRECKMALWSHPGSDVTGMVARCEKVADTSEKLLGGEVYHYHTKLMMKAAKTGGSHLWHQDYGYWYKNGCLFPDMLTVFISIDKCNKANGCLQILRGSHKCGRIDHLMVAGQTGADIERVKEIERVCPMEYVEMEPGIVHQEKLNLPNYAMELEMTPGNRFFLLRRYFQNSILTSSDALFFHSNLLHTSGPNNSDLRRWAFLVAYNTKANNPVIPHHHPQYTPLEKVPNTAIKDCTNVTDMSGKEFLNPTVDKTVKLDEKAR